MEKHRVYPVKGSEIAAIMQDFYQAKIERNRRNGYTALSSGEFKPFTGYAREDMSNIFNFVLELDEPSRVEVIERVVDPLQKLAEVYKIPSIFAGKGDIPPHITLDIGTFRNFPEEKKKIIIDYLSSNKAHLNKLSAILTGLVYHMDTLVMAPNSYICVGKFNEEQGAPFRSRYIIESMMRRSLKELGESIPGVFSPPSPYDDLLHSSAGRVVGEVPKKDLAMYAQEAYATVR